MNRRNFIKSMATFLALGAVARATRAAGVAEEGEQEVEKRDFGRTGWKLFPVVFGGIVSMQDGQPASDRYVAWAIEHGVNYFDVAPSYGDAQEKLGNSLKNDRRQVYLACKTAERLRRDAEKEFLASLRALHTDYLDVYQLHGLASQQDFDLAFGPGGAIELLDEAKRKGQVRKLGITAHSEEIALKALEAYDFDTVMFPLNWQLQLRNGYGGRLVREARKRGLGIIGIKSLIQRPWLSPEEHSASGLPKSWCKPIDREAGEFRIAAMKYAFKAGAEVIVPPGDFVNFSYAVENIGKVLEAPLSGEEMRLLEREYPKVKDEPFFESA